MTQSTHPGTRQLARSGCLAVVLLFALALVSGPALGQTDAPSASIENVTYTGNGNITVSETGLLLWHSASHEFTVAVSAPSEFDAEVCLLADATGRELGCEQTVVSANATDSVAVEIGEWPANMTGEQSLRVVLRDRETNASDPVDQRSLTVTSIETDGDLDGDGLANQREVLIGTNPAAADTDGDNLSDSAEVTTYDVSPVNPDTDGDGLTDGAEIRLHLTDPMNADSDGDGLTDSRELDIGTSPYNPDSDGDGLVDAVEVNTYNTNATAADTDSDGLDDGSELTRYRTNPEDGDTDDDGLSDALEVYTYESDPGDPDTDNDGLTDGVEVHGYQTEPTIADTDDDGLSDGREVTNTNTNPLNSDTDGDGLADGAEVNQYGTNPLAIDTDGDGTSDRLEVETGMFPAIPRPRLVAAVVLLTLTAATAGFYGAKGRVPGRRAFTALGARVRAARRGLATEPTDDTPVPERTEPLTRGSGSLDAGENAPSTPLPNEDRVLQILDAHDGQIRQSDIVDQTGWSKAKVSRVLSKMEEAGKVTKIDVGRENVVTRPEDIPSGASSPFES